MPLFLKSIAPELDIFGNRELFNFNRDPSSGESDSALTLINWFTPILNVNANSTFEFLTPAMKGFRFNHSLSTTGTFGNFNFEKYDRFGLSMPLWGYDEVMDSLVFNKEGSFVSNTANNQINLASTSLDTVGNLKLNIAKKIPNTQTYKGYQLSYEYSDSIGDSFSLYRDSNSTLDRLFAHSETLNVFLFYRSISMNSNRITNLGSAILSSDGVNKGQMDNADTSTLNAAKSYTDTTAYIVGEYRLIAGNTVPSKFLLCDGSSVSKTTYAALFAVIGISFGGTSGGTTFNLPDLRGKVLAATSSANILGISAGVDSQVLTTAQLPTHTHTATDTAVAAYAGSGATSYIKTGTRSDNAVYYTGVSSGSSTSPLGYHTGNSETFAAIPTSNTHSHPIALSNSGSSAAVDMRQSTCYGGNYYIYTGV